MNKTDTLDIPRPNVRNSRDNNADGFLNNELRVEVETFNPEHEINNLAKAAASTMPTSLTQNVLDEEVCQICYESVTPHQADSLPGTALTRCRHVFCDTCWVGHVRTRCSTGATQVTCPAFNCDVTADPVTLLSLVHATEVGLLLQRHREQLVETSSDTKWCPNPSCGRAIKIKVHHVTDDLCYDVTCVCGISVCFSCFGDPHWPAGCEQAEDYHQRLGSIRVSDQADEDSSETQTSPTQIYKNKPVVMKIDGRFCPGCKNFIEKNGGCPYMYCNICGIQFCWTCMEPHGDIMHGCKPNLHHVNRNSREVFFKHIDERQGHTLEGTNSQKVTKGRSRTKLYQRAKQQRAEREHHISMKTIDTLALKIAMVASKDSDFKQEVSP